MWPNEGFQESAVRATPFDAMGALAGTAIVLPVCWFLPDVSLHRDERFFPGISAFQTPPMREFELGGLRREPEEHRQTPAFIDLGVPSVEAAEGQDSILSLGAADSLILATYDGTTQETAVNAEAPTAAAPVFVAEYAGFVESA